MSKLDKLLARLSSEPRDFKWSELESLFKKLNFQKIEGSGSRVKFYHAEREILFIHHKPHPEPTMKLYAVKQVIVFLKDNGYI